MTAQTQKSLMTLGIFGALVFLAWKIWPTVKHAISGGGSGGTGSTAGGVGGGSQGYPQPGQKSSGSGGGSGGPHIPDTPNPPSRNNSFGKWLYNLTRNQTLLSGGPLADPLYGSVAGYDSTALDNYQFPSQSIDQFYLPSSSIWGSSDINTSYDPSLDNFQFDAAAIDLGSGGGGGGGGFYGGIVDPGFYDQNFDNPDYVF